MQAIVRYTVKLDKVDENLRLVKNLCAELNEKKPVGLRYAAFLAEDGVTFFHMPFIDGDESSLTNTETFKAFKKDIKDRYDEVAVHTLVREVGSFNFFR